MPDPNNTSLIEFKNWTLRIREAAKPSARLLLLIHGFTGDENSMWVFARNLSPDYWILAPRAPFRAEGGGYSWRERFDSSQFGHPSVEQLRPNAEGLIRLVDEYSASAEIDAGTFDVMGFSQGAVMSNVLTFLYPHRIRRAAILAGFVPDGLDELAPQRPLQDKPFFVTHGTKDDTVNIERARRSIAILERAGAQVTYCEDDVGHKVSMNCLRALNDFLAN